MDIRQLFDNYEIDVDNLEKSDLIDYEFLFPNVFEQSVNKIKLIDFIKFRLFSHMLKSGKEQFSEENMLEIFEKFDNEDFYYAVLGIIYKKIPFELCTIRSNEGKIIDLKYMTNPEWRKYIHTEEGIKLGNKFKGGYDIVRAIGYEKKINWFDFLLTKSDGGKEIKSESIEDIKKSLKNLKQSDDGMKSLLESFERVKKELEVLQK